MFHDDSNNEQRRMQIRESEERVRLLLSTIPVAILVLNENGQIQLSNRSFRSLLDEGVGSQTDDDAFAWKKF